MQDAWNIVSRRLSKRQVVFATELRPPPSGASPLDFAVQDAHLCKTFSIDSAPTTARNVYGTPSLSHRACVHLGRRSFPDDARSSGRRLHDSSGGGSRRGAGARGDGAVSRARIFFLLRQSGHSRQGRLLSHPRRAVCESRRCAADGARHWRSVGRLCDAL